MMSGIQFTGKPIYLDKKNKTTYINPDTGFLHVKGLIVENKEKQKKVELLTIKEGLSGAIGVYGEFKRTPAAGIWTKKDGSGDVFTHSKMQLTDNDQYYWLSS